MKNKKLLQLHRDLRLVTSRSFHFGNEKKQSWWKRRRKLILGTTAAVVATTAIVGGGIYYNKRKAEELEKSKNLTEEQKAKKIKQEEEERERDQKDEENKLQQAKREFEKERTKVRLALLDEERKLKELEAAAQKNATPENKEKVKNLLEKINEKREQEFRLLVDEEKRKILGKINELKTLPTDELAKVATIPRSFFEKMLEYGANAKEKIIEFFSRAKSNSSQPKPPKSPKEKKEKEKESGGGGEDIAKKIFNSLSPKTIDKLGSVVASLGSVVASSPKLTTFVMNKLIEHLGGDLSKAPLGTEKGAEGLIAAGIPVNSLGSLSPELTPELLQTLAPSLLSGSGAQGNTELMKAVLSGGPVAAFSASGILDNPQQIAKSAGVDPNLLTALVPALTQSGGSITPALLQTFVQGAGGLDQNMISQFAPAILQHAGVNIPVNGPVGDKNEPKTVQKALDVPINPVNVVSEATKNPQLANMLINPMVQNIFAGFLGGGGGGGKFGKRKINKINKINNKLKELLDDYALLTGRRLNKFGHMMDSMRRDFYEKTTDSKTTDSKTTNNDDGSFTPEMFPNIKISLPQQIQLVELVTRFYTPTGSNSILDTLLKPFLNFITLKNDEKNVLVGKIVSYFTVLYNSYINKGVVPQEAQQSNNNSHKTTEVLPVPVEVNFNPGLSQAAAVATISNAWKKKLTKGKSESKQPHPPLPLTAEYVAEKEKLIKSLIYYSWTTYTMDKYFDKIDDKHSKTIDNETINKYKKICKDYNIIITDTPGRDSTSSAIAILKSPPPLPGQEYIKNQKIRDLIIDIHRLSKPDHDNMGLFYKDISGGGGGPGGGPPSRYYEELYRVYGVEPGTKVKDALEILNKEWYNEYNNTLQKATAQPLSEQEQINLERGFAAWDFGKRRNKQKSKRKM